MKAEMSSYFMKVDKTAQSQNTSMVTKEARPVMPKEKVIAYEEKSVGSTPFFQCEACPYMALAEDDIKFHLFTAHPDLAKSNGLADNIQISCPGCASAFDAEETLRTHLRNHHKMGIKDVKKMVKSLVQIALKNAKLKKNDTDNDLTPVAPITEEVTDAKIPQVIEIAPDNVNANSDLPKGVAFISVDELNKMSTPNFEKVDPKEIIQEASINIVYTSEVCTQYVNVNEASTSGPPRNVIQLSSVTPDLISSIQPHVSSETVKLTSPLKENLETTSQMPLHVNQIKKTDKNIVVKKKGTLCSVGGCHIRLESESIMAYHKRCHQNGDIVCPECGKVFAMVEELHSHLWKVHGVDMELPTCEVCGFKTYRRYRLINIHMKCHEENTIRSHVCPICSKSFKNSNQLSKHKMIHKKDVISVQCTFCQLKFNSQRHLKNHVATIHEKLKPLKCCHCDYTTSRNMDMKLHLRSHTGDKPYSCNQCSYRAADHNAIRRHKKLHSKEGRYKCKYCGYTTIQSTVFASHMITKHPGVNTEEIHQCSFCRFKSISKEKYLYHLTTHADKDGIQLLIEMAKNKTNKPTWNIPSGTVEKSASVDDASSEQNKESNPKTVNTIPIELYDCDSLNETLPQNFSTNYCPPPTDDSQAVAYNTPVIVADLSKDENNSDCLISESSNDTIMDRHQFPPQRPLQITYDSSQSNIHGFLNTSVSMEQTLLQSSSVNSIPTNHSSRVDNIGNNIMSNFPIRLPPVPQMSIRNNTMIKPLDKISLPMIKVTGPIIKPTQILPVPSSSNSPVNTSTEQEGAPRKKPKISVKSNLILKGPDQENMFHSQQKMAFRRLEDNERFGLGNPVTFNNLITTQFMQLQPEPVLSESPSNIMPYPQETMLDDTATTPVDSGMNNDSQMFTFNQQMNVNSITLLPPQPKIQTNDPSYIKLETTIKQNTQSPSLERMCNANILNNQAISRDYKASPPLEDIHKNMSEIKNEVKSDAFYNIALNNSATNPPLLDQYLIDNIIGEQYPGHMDLSAVVLSESADDQQNDVIEIDDNSDDHKLLPRFDINFPLESLYLMHNDFHFLENEIPTSNIPTEVGVNELNRMVTEVPIINQKENLDAGTADNNANDFSNFIQGKKDPMMNTSVRVRTNKINVKNIELMKN